MSDRTKLPAATREKIDTALDKLIALLDAIDGDPDLEESDPREPVGDDEPSLGATEALNQERAWRAAVAPGTDLEFDGDTCPDADKEPDTDGEPWLAGCPMDGGQDLELDPADEEPSLGASSAINQEKAWRAPNVGWSCYVDAEFDGDTCPDADREPDLGSPEYLGLTSHVDQEDWARSRGSDDRELDTADDEPSLASFERHDSQISWSIGSDDDCEAEHDGREPDEDREWDEAEQGIGDMDGAMEQYGIRGGLGERVEQ
jgi:hypothetical protein